MQFHRPKRWRQNDKTITILRRHVTQGERDSLNQVSETHINMFEILKKNFLFNAKLDISKVDLKYGSTIMIFLIMRAFGILPMVPLEILPMVPLVANGTIGNTRTLNVSRLPMVPLVPMLPLVETLVSPMVSTVV